MIIEWRVVRAPWYKRLLSGKSWLIQRRTAIDPWITVDRHHTKEAAELAMFVTWRVR